MLKNFDVAVIFGGVSSENEISVITGTMACNVLKNGDKSVLPLYIDRDGIIYANEKLADVTVFKDGGYKSLARCGFANGQVIIFNRSGKPKHTVGIGCMLNCCHGGAGEGGGVSGLCRIIGVPFASAGIYESAAFMDKYLTKLTLQSLQVNTAKYAYSRDITGAIAGAKSLGYPVIVKPATLGSSIGIEKCNDEQQLKRALDTAFQLDGGVLIEEFLSDRREINCAAYASGGKVIISPLEEAATSGDVLSYDDKYCGGGKRIFPAELDEKTAELIKGETERVYSALNMRGIVRFDFIISRGKVYISEVNTVPGSLSQYLLSDSYKNFYYVLLKVIEQAKADFAEQKGRLVISTGILNGITPVTGIKK